MMNILFVTPFDPRINKYGGGGVQRTHLLWESLTRHGRVFTYIYDWHFTTEGEMTDGEHPYFRFKPEIKKNNLGYKVNFIPVHLTRNELNIGGFIVSPDPSIVFNCTHFDIVVSRYVFPLFLFKYWDLTPIIIDIDDHPMQVFKTRYSPHLPFPSRQLGYFLTYWKTSHAIKKSMGGWVSNKEQVGMCGCNYHYLPNIPNRPSPDYLENYGDRKNLLTVGSMIYDPNKEGVNLFLNEVWPSFHAKHPEVKYYLVGDGAREEEITAWKKFEGVEYLGGMDNLELLYQGILATVVPIYSGGGTCIKTLESMAFSRICLSSEFGARGLPEDVLSDKKGVIIYDSAYDFIESYEKILNRDYRERKEEQGREVIDRLYSKEVFQKSVDKLISSLK